ncbi:hypothetical protein EPH_0003580 [Eimeria praecox]|uniref:Uncharacterized protein n=1 Tax=Eimeria praecox TaxID=51316 RepID=U6H5D6_9EIME|nr:hypothetical protein EPH_0003580 [Eimeria praecox]
MAASSSCDELADRGGKTDRNLVSAREQQQQQMPHPVLQSQQRYCCSKQLRGVHSWASPEAPHPLGI